MSARLKNFLMGWLLVLGLKEGLVECAIVCVKSVVILLYLPDSVLLLLWVGLTVEVYKSKNMQILLQKYFHPLVAAAMARLVRLKPFRIAQRRDYFSLFFMTRKVL